MLLKLQTDFQPSHVSVVTVCMCAAPARPAVSVSSQQMGKGSVFVGWMRECAAAQWEKLAELTLSALSHSPLSLMRQN